jgi:predicted nucleic acid-binding protein
MFPEEVSTLQKKNPPATIVLLSMMPLRLLLQNKTFQNVFWNRFKTDLRLPRRILKSALRAADISLSHDLAMADAIVYSTAKTYSAQLVTSDSHLKSLEGTRFIE